MKPTFDELLALAALRPGEREDIASDGRWPQRLVRRLDKVTIDVIVQAYVAGQTTTQLAAEYGVSVNGVNAPLRSREVSIRTQVSLIDEQVAEAVREYGNGMTV